MKDMNTNYRKQWIREMYLDLGRSTFVLDMFGAVLFALFFVMVQFFFHLL